jgi:predicted TIM-barrel fold metal-dependent hydrolase
MNTWDTIDRYMILSSDTHAGAEMRTYKDYLDVEFHDDFERWAASIVNPWIDLSDPEKAKVNWDSGARTAACDREGICGEVIFPNTLTPFYDILVHLSGVPATAPEYARRWAGLRAHNRWLVEFCRDSPQRRKGLIQLLPNDIDHAVAELQWAHGTGVIGGVMLPSIPPSHTVEPYFHPRYDALWAACAELALPVHQHMGSGNPELGDLPVAKGIAFAEHDLWPKRTLLHLIMGGVFERHPTLTVVWTEMWGMRWVLEELHRIEQRLHNVQSRYADHPTYLNYARTFGSPTIDSLSLTPLEYWQRNCYIGASMLPRSDVRYRHVLGVDRVMWGDDYPHPEGATDYVADALRTTMWDVREVECRAMLAGTAAAVYGFDLEALTPLAARIGPKLADVHAPLGHRPPSRGEPFRQESLFEEVLALGR